MVKAIIFITQANFYRYNNGNKFESTYITYQTWCYFVCYILINQAKITGRHIYGMSTYNEGGDC